MEYEFVNLPDFCVDLKDSKEYPSFRCLALLEHKDYVGEAIKVKLNVKVDVEEVRADAKVFDMLEDSYEFEIVLTYSEKIGFDEE
jgi:hypothetical protein